MRILPVSLLFGLFLATLEVFLFRLQFYQSGRVAIFLEVCLRTKVVFPDSISASQWRVAFVFKGIFPVFDGTVVAKAYAPPRLFSLLENKDVTL